MSFNIITLAVLVADTCKTTSDCCRDYDCATADAHGYRSASYNIER